MTRPVRTTNQGLKALIGALSVAATLGGWAALAEGPRADSAAAATAAAPVAAAPAPDWLLAPPPIPTLAPVAGLADQPAPAAAAPQQPAVAPAPTAQPAPLIVTRSSR